MTIPAPGHDEIVLTAPDSARLCNSLACVRAGRATEVIVTYGVLNDPGSSLYSRKALWREQWGMSCPLCSACWEQSRQVAVKYRPRLVVIDATGTAPAAPQTSGGRARPTAPARPPETHPPTTRTAGGRRRECAASIAAGS